jgi:signal peptidase I
VKKFFKEWWSLFAFALFVLIFRFFIFSPVLVDGHSMDPTLADGQRMIMSKFSKIHRFDIIVSIEPNEPDKKIIKRVIGLPGDTVSFDNDKLTINGKKYPEPYLDEYKKLLKKNKLKTTYSYSSVFQEIAKTAATFTMNANEESKFTIKVPLKHCLFLGDNRLVSKDGRNPSVGVIPEDNIQGVAKFTFWPPSKIGFVKKVSN